MPGLLLHVGAVTACVHQAPVPPKPPATPRVFVNGAVPVLSIVDLMIPAGCPFTVPGPKPQPCVRVQVEPAARVMVMGQPAAILTPTAMCLSVEQIPQGPPNALATQKRVIAT